MKRRDFLFGAACLAAGSRISHAEAPIAIPLRPSNASWPVMPPDFTGLSYETGQLYNPDFFSPKNIPLVATFRRLNPHGVLRLGGHLSNITPWEGVGQTDPKQRRGVEHGIKDYWEWPLVDPIVQQHRNGTLTRHALENLRAFLDTVGWRLIYGLNFACGSSARAADEAHAVASILGDRLITFVIGNEPDGFAEDPYFRPKSYDLNQYLLEYESWVQAIRQRLPHAVFAGPDTDGKVDTWVLEFARRTKGDLQLLTSHYYGMGPASDPSMTAERLLQRHNPSLAATIAGVQAARKAAGGTAYRMDEGNSCFGGGRKDVSDAYASALWAADYMLTAASAGFSGVNLHGGGTGIYTPIESSSASLASPRPVYFGMLFAQQFAGCRVMVCDLKTDENFNAYQGSTSNRQLLALINKGSKPLQITLPEQLRSRSRLEIRKLEGPDLHARTGVRFERTSISGGPNLPIQPYSALLIEAR
jgi:hypothetical protein